MHRRLENMIVAVTGASSGIGQALAQQLAGRGAKLALAARRMERLEELNKSLGGGHFVMRTDVSQRGDCESFITRTLEHFGRIDTLVANAGYGLYRTVADTDGDDVRAMFETNVFGTTDVIHAAAPAMLRQDCRDGLRGQIMIVSSSAARRGVPFIGVYAATKSAQLQLAEALRVELRDRGIAVTSVHPIMTRTEFGAAAEAASDVKLPRSQKPSQKLDIVVRKMVRAIEKPRFELWPHTPTRFALLAAALLPRVADAVMHRYFRAVEEHNQKMNKPQINADERR